MKTTTPEPLSSEERALATMLARVAPHGVPSPEIDASILSASHDAVAGNPARSRRPRWPVAMGLAASMVLAVGVAWQLRPPATEAVGFDAVPVEARSSAEASSAATTVPEVAPSEPPDGAMPDDAIEDFAAAPAPNKTLAPPARRAAVESSRKTAPDAVLPAPARAPREPAAVPEPVYVPSSPPAPPAPPSGVAEHDPGPSAGFQRLESARQADTAASTTSEAASTAGTTTSARRELRVAPSSERMQENASSAANGAARARRTELQVPVAADAQLQVDDWLERVRTRYGLGDEDAARRSLVLFVQDHPTEPVPDDLEPLLDE